MNKFKPIGDKVLIKPGPEEEKTKGGLIIPDAAKEPPLRGVVVAVGPGKDGNIMTVQEDDYVMYGRYAGQSIEHDGEKYIIMREDDIFMVVE